MLDGFDLSFLFELLLLSLLSLLLLRTFSYAFSPISVFVLFVKEDSQST